MPSQTESRAISLGKRPGHLPSDSVQGVSPCDSDQGDSLQRKQRASLLRQGPGHLPSVRGQSNFSKKITSASPLRKGAGQFLSETDQGVSPQTSTNKSVGPERLSPCWSHSCLRMRRIACLIHSFIHSFRNHSASVCCMPADSTNTALVLTELIAESGKEKHKPKREERVCYRHCDESRSTSAEQ